LLADEATRIPNAEYACLDVEFLDMYWGNRTGGPGLSPTSGHGPFQHDAWYTYMRQHHPDQLYGLSSEAEEEVLSRTYREAVQEFFTGIMREAKAANPNLKWGFYGYPWRRYGEYLQPAPNRWTQMNDEMQWLFEQSDVVFPAMYMNLQTVADGDPSRRPGYQWEESFHTSIILANIREFRRLVGDKEIIAFTGYRYHQSLDDERTGDYCDPIDLRLAIEVPVQNGLDGVIIWDILSNQGDHAALQSFMTSSISPMVRRLHGVADPEAPNLPPGGGGGGDNPPSGGGDSGGGDTPPSGGGDSGGGDTPPSGGGDSGGGDTPPSGGGDSGGGETPPSGGGDSGGGETPPSGGGDSGGGNTPPSGGGSGGDTNPPELPPQPASGGDGSGNTGGGGGNSGGETGGGDQPPPPPPQPVMGGDGGGTSGGNTNPGDSGNAGGTDPDAPRAAPVRKSARVLSVLRGGRRASVVVAPPSVRSGTGVNATPNTKVAKGGSAPSTAPKSKAAPAPKRVAKTVLPKRDALAQAVKRSQVRTLAVSGRSAGVQAQKSTRVTDSSSNMHDNDQ
jgi:hypothetical protein